MLECGGQAQCINAATFKSRSKGVEQLLVFDAEESRPEQDTTTARLQLVHYLNQLLHDGEAESSLLPS